MDIILAVTISDDLKDTAQQRCKELLVATLTQIPFVQGTVALKPHNIGPSHAHDSGVGYTPDESTRLVVPDPGDAQAMWGEDAEAVEAVVTALFGAHPERGGMEREGVAYNVVQALKPILQGKTT